MAKKKHYLPNAVLLIIASSIFASVIDIFLSKLAFLAAAASIDVTYNLAMLFFIWMFLARIIACRFKHVIAYFRLLRRRYGDTAMPCLLTKDAANNALILCNDYPLMLPPTLEEEKVDGIICNCRASNYALPCCWLFLKPLRKVNILILRSFSKLCVDCFIVDDE